MNSSCKYANYVESGITHNARFDLNHAINRDHSNYPFWCLREALKENGIELNTPDMNDGREIVFELHMNAVPSNASVPLFVLLMETAQIYPLNESQKLLAQYRGIFTWNDVLVRQSGGIKINFPNRFSVSRTAGLENRSKFCCLIAGNRVAAQHGEFDLYAERVRTIRWFEHHAPQQFDLYGSGWEAEPPRPGRLGRIWHRLAQQCASRLGRRAFPSYRGKVASKSDTLHHYAFAICYENVRDLPGYITEKIFDCFFAGCVPVYWGASNVTDYIPRECFIDRRQFSSHEEMYHYLTNISQAVYREYQVAILSFLASDSAQPFSAEYFAKRVSGSILERLER